MRKPRPTRGQSRQEREREREKVASFLPNRAVVTATYNELHEETFTTYSLHNISFCMIGAGYVTSKRKIEKL